MADIITALRYELDACECRARFAPGFVTECLADLVWSRSHDEEKRELVVREVLRREGYAAQRTLIGEVTPADTPRWKISCAHAKPYSGPRGIIIRRGPNASAFCAHRESIIVIICNANR